MPNIIIAIDGFSSSGKSTMARQLAKTVGYRYVDSGAMYRAVALYALKNNLFIDSTPDVDAIVASLPDIKIDFKLMPDGSQHTLLNGQDVENEIRSFGVSNAVSPVAAIPEVRHAMVALQQALGKQKGIVMDGRDIGTTVFPDAELKLFVNATAENRAKRRFKELQEKGDNHSTFEQVLENVLSRDHIDMTRSESPLRRADDAIDIDNSNMTIDEQNSLLLELFNNKIKELTATK
ncbi:MAG: (d)CMP kinase [Muribaculaceae bacterium]|nr:(d)CMP kinase [Muribaculaceae bacterium]MDE5968494.1 (d)CMP kinase [Muribaculaceae bacterium]